MRRASAIAASVLLAVSLLPGAWSDRALAQGRERTVNVYNWSDYIEPSVIEAFTKETGIKVKYDTFDANDTLETKLLAGKSGYDVVVPTAYFLERQIKAGVFQKLDKSKLPNLGNVWPEIAQAARDLRSGQPVRRQLHVGHHRHRLQRQEGARHPRARRDRSRTRWRPGTSSSSRRAWRSSRTAASTCWIPPTTSCRRRCTISGSIRTPSSRPTSRRRAELLIKIRPNVRKFHSSEYLNALASGEICLVVGWSGDIKQAQKRAAEAKAGVEIGYAIPKDGAQMFFDNLAIPKDAQNVAEAHAFIDYLLRPEVAAKNSNFISLCQRQSREPEADRQGGARRPDRLSGRGDAGEPLHHHRARPEDAAGDQPAVDEDQDGAVRALSFAALRSLCSRSSGIGGATLSP